jgi:hypothetical protein
MAQAGSASERGVGAVPLPEAPVVGHGNVISNVVPRLSPGLLAVTLPP